MVDPVNSLPLWIDPLLSHPSAPLVPEDMRKGSGTEPGLKVLKRRGSTFWVLNGRGWVPG